MDESEYFCLYYPKRWVSKDKKHIGPFSCLIIIKEGIRYAKWLRA